jgi:metal-responsive CopG/Arc/MetJ family transcriptional regulator
MKEKTSVTLSPEVLTGIDQAAGSRQSRSAFIEAILVDYLRKQVRQKRDARDIELINRNASRLNRDAVDGLQYQTPEDW